MVINRGVFENLEKTLQDETQTTSTFAQELQAEEEDDSEEDEEVRVTLEKKRISFQDVTEATSTAAAEPELKADGEAKDGGVEEEEMVDKARFKENTNFVPGSCRFCTSTRIESCRRERR